MNVEQVRQWRAELVARHAQELATTDAFLNMLQATRVTATMPANAATGVAPSGAAYAPSAQAIAKARAARLARSVPAKVTSVPAKRNPEKEEKITLTRAIRRLAKGTFTIDTLRARMEAEYPELKPQLKNLSMALWCFKERGEIRKEGRGSDAQWTVVKILSEQEARAKNKAQLGGGLLSGDYEAQKAALGIAVNRPEELGD